MPYRRQRLEAIALHEIRPYDVLHIRDKRYGISAIHFMPNALVRRASIEYRTDVVKLEMRPWLRWKGYLKTHELVALCAGQCEHGGMHVITRADKDRTTVRPPKCMLIEVDRYNQAPFIKRRKEQADANTKI